MGLMAGIGHNRGPSVDEGQSWRRFAWARAREALLPTLPIEVVRLRVNRAKELGLEYKTYASVRASTGRDVIGFLFSNNALRVLKAGQGVPAERVAVLEGLRGCDRVGVVHAPLLPGFQGEGLDAVFAAPSFTAPWSAMRDQLRGVIRARGKPADGFLVVGETAFERDWAEAGKTAGFLSGERYFGVAG
jgi:hypothetical protein